MPKSVYLTVSYEGKISEKFLPHFNVGKNKRKIAFLKWPLQNKQTKQQQQQNK